MLLPLPGSAVVEMPGSVKVGRPRMVKGPQARKGSKDFGDVTACFFILVW